MTDIRSSLRTRRPKLAGRGTLTSSASTVLIGLAIVTVLYLGREVFVPIALAVLLSFALAPFVRVLRRCHVPRVGAVTMTVLLAFLLIFGIAAMMARQVAQLAENLPQYQRTIAEKITSLRDAADGAGIVEQMSSTLSGLKQEISKPTSSAPSGAPAASSGPKAIGEDIKPMPVEIQRPALKPLEIIRSILSPILAPLATAGIVIIFAIFILLYRQDLRDRFIRLAGSRDLGRTTEAMDDAARRLSRYFLSQAAINTSFGVIIGAGLWFIGIPNPVLWGVFGALLRFVPYLGAFIAAAIPAALAIAVDPGWSMLMGTLALFAVVEPIMSQIVEPWLYGHNTALSPVAVVVAATFWTWLWGPIGLLLSTPLTVCLVVLGRHVEHLAFLEIILGDEPALTAEENFYQRMLVGDPHEAADQAEKFLKERSLSAFYDEVAIRGLVLAQADLTLGLLETEKLVQIRDTAHEVVDDLSDHDDATPTVKRKVDDPEASSRPDGKAAEGNTDLAVLQKEEILPDWREVTPVLCIGGRSPLDEAAATMLAQLLEKHGIGVRVEPRDTLTTVNIFRLDPTGVVMVCMSYLDGSRPATVRYLVQRLRRKLPNVIILTGFWGLEDDAMAKELASAAGADLCTTSLRHAVELCIEKARFEDAEPVHLEMGRTEDNHSSAA